ncbi:MAG: ABC transporter permease [Candidatus Aminicenantaceae bacterium]
MITLKLAIKNLLGAGLRTWLNVIVLSFSFVVIIWTQGLYEGMTRQTTREAMNAEYGGGQYWHSQYDPYDSSSLPDAHGTIPTSLQTIIDQGHATPILILQGTIYPQDRFQSVVIKGIEPSQDILTIPSDSLKSEEELPVLIGNRMSENTGLKVGDYFTVRWRDENGTFDAKNAKIVHIMNTIVSTIDNGQIWVPLDKIQNYSQMQNKATLVVAEKDHKPSENIAGWDFKNLSFLLSDLEEIVQTKTAGASIIYIILLALAMLAIFDTQVLSIFRRRKEMGTLMALGFTRGKVIKLFTLEGALHGVLAAIVAAIYGIPFLTWFAKTGWALPEATESFGLGIGEKLFPTYSAGLVIGTTILVLVVTTIVSFLPTRKIAKLKPTDALRGKMS